MSRGAFSVTSASVIVPPPPYLSGSLDEFVELVIPELQCRGLFRTEYEYRTLRENLGLPRPINKFNTADSPQLVTVGSSG